jgi:hypothetical protein
MNSQILSKFQIRLLNIKHTLQKLVLLLLILCQLVPNIVSLYFMLIKIVGKVRIELTLSQYHTSKVLFTRPYKKLHLPSKWDTLSQKCYPVH